MNVQQFQAIWCGNTLTERAASQSHFIDVCHLLGLPTPAEADPAGTFFTFERGATPADLKRRTLTNLYNTRSTWLTNAHAILDRAVWSAYGWPAEEDPATVEEDVILGRLLALNLERISKIGF